MLERHLQISKRIRKCQRNWDISKPIPQEHINHLAYIAKHAPSKQDESYFDLAIITSRTIIDEVHKRSIGFSQFDDSGNPLPSIRNPQTAANLLIIWLQKIPSTMRQYYQNQPGWHVPDPNEKNGDPKRQDESSRGDNSYTSIGISAGITAWVAADLGYVTGFSKNLGEDFDYLKELLNTNLKPTYGLGIGFPDINLPHNVSHEGNEYYSFSQLEKLTNIYEF